MLLKIQTLGEDPTVSFAAEELRRTMAQMDPGAEIALSRRAGCDPAAKSTLWVGQDAAFAGMLPKVDDAERDDAIAIDVSGGCGVITGTNPRSVLLAAYRFLRELGCAWVRPGKSGEIIPRVPLAGTAVKLSEAASYRHRGVCIEGAVSYEHVLNMIDWLPKVGMNSYFNQFRVPYTFFERWYAHQNNPELEAHEVSVEEVAGMVRSHVAAIKRRGMLYHAAGHGWTCEPFGIEGNSWDIKEYIVPEESVQALAEVNGVRELSGGIPLNTNLCYGNSEVRERMTTAIADYCRDNPEVDYLHFWLADGWNNHCECEKCRDTIPADFYVTMLNELDGKLAAAGTDTRVVFLIYMDLLWEPIKARLNSPDRFVLMFAPITRTYSVAYADADLEAPVELEPYERNKVALPREVALNVARLKKWQAQTKGGDSFIYDYHFMWDHFRDPGYIEMAKVLFKDMQNLDALGLNGMISCQCQRVFFPTGLGMALMAEALWNKTADYDTAAKNYFARAYGEDGPLAYRYLSQLSTLFDPAYLRHETPKVDEGKGCDFARIPAVLDDFSPTVEANLCPEKNESAAVRRSWALLVKHAELCRILARALARRAAGDDKAAAVLWEDAAAWARLHEAELHEVFDVHLFINVMQTAIKGEDTNFH